jgi:S-adenosylmethionine:tRNA ribosyltransferase-isomerase
VTAVFTGFTVPPDLIATAPPEESGTPRDQVRMLVAGPEGVRHARAADLPAVLRAGDVLVLNTSDTLAAELPGVTAAGDRVTVHLSTPLPQSGVDYPAALAGTEGPWVVEVRAATAGGSTQSYADRTGAAIRVAGGGEVTVTGSHPPGLTRSRLWRAVVRTPVPLAAYLAEYGAPIRYPYVPRRWPLSAYRNEYADTPGSVTMPSAGRPLTRRLLRQLAGRGVQVATLALHCGVSSLESGDPPYAEWFELPAATAATVNAARADGRRVVAAGTTVVRALESAAGGDGTVRPASGWTDLVVTPERGVSTVDGILTGWHEPEASHLQMLEAVAGRTLLTVAYRAALSGGYRWHEFGDVNLLLRR